MFGFDQYNNKPWSQRKLHQRLYIVIEDQYGNCEFVRWLENETELNITTDPNKAFIADTYDEYQEEADRCEKYFPDFKYVIYSEKDLPTISKLRPYNGLHSRPLVKGINE